MKYEQKSFTVPASSEKSPPDCRHGWIDAHGKCVLCGDPSPVKIPRKAFRSLRAKVAPLAKEMALAVARER